jgi:hypothetical protein
VAQKAAAIAEAFFDRNTLIELWIKNLMLLE